MADMPFYENTCGGNRRTSTKRRGWRPAVRAEAVSASLAIAASMNSVLHVFACRGSRPAKAKAGFAR
jgi:hypothetical protein